MSVVLSICSNGNHKKVKVIKVLNDCTWEDLFVMVTKKLMMKKIATRAFETSGQEIDQKNTKVEQLKSKLIVFSTGNDFVGFNTTCISTPKPEDTNTQVLIAMTVGSVAYLTKPMKFEYTLIYSDGMKRITTMTLDDARKMAKKYQVIITRSNDYDFECFCSGSCSCTSSSSED